MTNSVADKTSAKSTVNSQALTAYPKVKVINLVKKFDDLTVLDDISFEVQKGEFLCIVGPTGCGKTTFLNSLTKLYTPTSGEILIDNEPVNLKKNNLAYIFQEYSTFPWLKVRENVEYGLKIKNLPANECKERAAAMLKLVGLEKYAEYYPEQLSAGMLQRVVIARAFVTEPELLLMDEPYGQLDASLRFYLEDELLKLWEKLHTTVIFITHNIEEAVYLGNRVLVLSNKPTKIKESISIDLPYKRNIADDKFVAYRNRITDLIKWW